MAMAGSPGTIRIAKKTMVTAASSVGIASAIRVMTKRSIRGPICRRCGGLVDDPRLGQDRRAEVDVALQLIAEIDVRAARIDLHQFEDRHRAGVFQRLDLRLAEQLVALRLVGLDAGR